MRPLLVRLRRWAIERRGFQVRGAFGRRPAKWGSRRGSTVAANLARACYRMRRARHARGTRGSREDPRVDPAPGDDESLPSDPLTCDTRDEEGTRVARAVRGIVRDVSTVCFGVRPGLDLEPRAR